MSKTNHIIGLHKAKRLSNLTFDLALTIYEIRVLCILILDTLYIVMVRVCVQLLWTTYTWTQS